MKSVAIVGCGPAGLSAAILLHDAGFEIRLFERFDKPRAVGSGLVLQPTGLAVLEKMRLRDAAQRVGPRIDAMRGRLAANGKLVLDIRYAALAGDLHGLAIHRASLFDVLYQAVLQRDIAIQNDATITAIERQANEKVQVIDAQSGQPLARVDLVVDASGSGSRLWPFAERAVRPRPLSYGALWATVDLADQPFARNRLEQRYRAASVMAGVLPCGRLPQCSSQLATYFWSIKNRDVDALFSGGLESWRQQALQVWPQTAGLLEQIQQPSQLLHARYQHHTLLPPRGRSIVYIGDAAHATSPQLGQGANMALLDAYALATALCAQPQLDAALTHYCALRRRHVRLYQLASLALTPFYQSDRRSLAALRDLMFGPLSRLPGSAGLVTRLGAGLLTRPLETIDSAVP